MLLFEAVIEFLKNTGTSSSITYAFLDNLPKTKSEDSKRSDGENVHKESKNQKIMDCLKVLIGSIERQASHLVSST